MQQQANASRYLRAKKKIVMSSPWNVIPLAHVRDISTNGEAYGKLARNIYGMGYFAEQSVYCVPMTASHLEKDGGIFFRILDSDFAQRIDKSKTIYGIIDGAHRVRAVQDIISLKYSKEPSPYFPDPDFYEMPLRIPEDDSNMDDYTMLDLVSAAQALNTVSEANIPCSAFDKIKGITRSIDLLECLPEYTGIWKHGFKNDLSRSKCILNIEKGGAYFNQLEDFDNNVGATSKLSGALRKRRSSGNNKSISLADQHIEDNDDDKEMDIVEDSGVGNTYNGPVYTFLLNEPEVAAYVPYVRWGICFVQLLYWHLKFIIYKN